MQPQLFNFKGQQVRTVTINEEPYFVGRDIADNYGGINNEENRFIMYHRINGTVAGSLRQ